MATTSVAVSEAQRFLRRVRRSGRRTHVEHQRPRVTKPLARYVRVLLTVIWRLFWIVFKSTKPKLERLKVNCCIHFIYHDVLERERDFALYIDEPSLVCSSVTLTGLLIEADPSYYTQLLGKNRKAWSINACLSPINSVSVVSDPTTFVDQSRQLNLSVLHVYIYWRSPPPKAIKQD